MVAIPLVKMALLVAAFANPIAGIDKLTAQINKEPSKPHLHHHCLFPRREGKQTESDMLMDSSLAHGPIYDRLRINLSVSGFEIPLLTP
jgi:hypothetical protein